MTAFAAHVQPEAARGSAARSALALAGVALFFTNLDGYAFAAWSAPTPVLWSLAFAGAAGLLVVLEPHRPVGLLRSPVGVWILAFFMMTTAWALAMSGLAEQTQELVDRYRSLAFLVTFALVFDDERARRTAVVAVAAAILAASAVNVAETLALVRFVDLAESERTVGRAAGFYINPNTSGLAITLGLAVVAESVPSSWRVPLVIASTIGVATTFSRGAAACLVVVFLWLAWRRALGGWRVVLTSVCLMFLLMFMAEYARSHALLNENTAARLALAKDDSGRLELALKAWNLFAESPWLGNGLATTMTWDSPDKAHNMFVTWAADHGVLGLLAFPALGLALVMANRASTCYALTLMLSGLFSHAMLGNRYSLLLIALATATGVPPGREVDRGGPDDSTP